MKDLRIDSLDRERCWKCGGKHFVEVDRPGSPGASSSGPLLDRKSFTCARCGTANKVGNALPYDGPSDPKYADEWKREQSNPEERGPVEGPPKGDESQGPTAAEAVQAEFNRMNLINGLGNAPLWLN